MTTPFDRQRDLPRQPRLLGVCPECGTALPLTEQGLIPTHNVGRTQWETCAGSKQKPEPLPKDAQE